MSTATEPEPQADAGPGRGLKTVMKSGTVCELAGITARQLEFWTNTDLIRPSVQDASGPGYARVYSIDDVVVVKVVRHLLDGGFSLQSTRAVVQPVRDALALGIHPHCWLVLGPQVETTALLEPAIRRQGGGMFAVLDLAAIATETLHDVDEWDKAHKFPAPSAD